MCSRTKLTVVTMVTLILVATTSSTTVWNDVNTWIELNYQVTTERTRLLSTMTENSRLFDYQPIILTSIPDLSKKIRAFLLDSHFLPIRSFLISYYEPFKLSTIEKDEKLVSSTLGVEVVRTRYRSTMGLLQSAFLADTQKPLGDAYSLPLEAVCALLPERNVPKLSVKDVCPSLDSCSTSVLSSGKSSCTPDNKCDVHRSLPLMMAIVWYKTAFAFVDRFCINRCIENGCTMENEYSKIAQELELLKAYTYMLMPDNQKGVIFRDAVKDKAYANLDKAMAMVEDRGYQTYYFAPAVPVCTELGVMDMCPLAQIYQDYLLLKKLQKQNQELRLNKDLRMYENIDNAKMIMLKQKSVDNLALLGAIGQLDDNLKVQVKGISSYFTGVAKYDQEIAAADVTYIKDSIQKFNDKFDAVEEKLKSSMNTLKLIAAGTALADVMDQTAILTAKVMENSNPLKAILTSPDIGGLLEQAGKLAKAAAGYAKAIALILKIQTVIIDTQTINTNLAKNAVAISSVKVLVDKITKGEDIGNEPAADTFVKQYAAYTPQVDRSQLDANMAMWSAMKSSACDILDDVEGVAANIIGGVAGAMLICENLEGTLAEFGTLRESVYDFQFDMMDALARVVKGNNAQRLSNEIQKEKTDILKGTALMAGFFMSQSQLQAQASLYCDKIEYSRQGQKIEACSPVGGLFTRDNLDTLTAYKDYKPDPLERYVYIPTQPQSPSDMGYISMAKLMEEKEVYFKIPRDVTWLNKFHWTLLGETSAPFVESFQLFLPNKDYNKDAGLQMSTRLEVTSVGGSYVAHSSDVLYTLPEAQSTYVTVYEEGYTRCPNGKEIDNPYSLCSNLPKVCHALSNEPRESLLPTILSTWRVKFTRQSAENELKWEAPNSMTDMLLIAKLKLRMMPRVSRKKLKKSRDKALFMDPANASKTKCCLTGNQYRESWNVNKCVDCPTNSNSNLGGYYCEVKPFVEQ